MIRFYLLLISLILLNISRSQSCLPNGITFTAQAQIDNFQLYHPNCTEIEGNVLIDGSNISNLNGLSVLTSFGGSLYVGNYPFGGTYLTSLTGLDNVTSVGGDLLIRSNNVLNSLTGLENLISVGGKLSIVDDFNLNNLSGLNSLTSIGGNVHISSNGLLNLTGLENLDSIGGWLAIEYENGLISLDGLNSLQEISGDLIIRYNYLLNSLTALNDLTYVGGELMIKGNPDLTSLSGLDNIDAGTISHLTIYGNFSLSACAVHSICNYLASPTWTGQVSNNASGCNSPEEVDSACVYVPVGENEYQSELLIFPNPSADYIVVEIHDIQPKSTEINIININGQKLIELEMKEDQIIVDISGLKDGVYFVQLVNEKQVEVRKFVKQ